LPSTRAQAEGLEVHPEQGFFIPPSKAGLCAAERVNPQRPAWSLIDSEGFQPHPITGTGQECYVLYYRFSFSGKVFKARKEKGVLRKTLIEMG
jgi:hypothetical protein